MSKTIVIKLGSSTLTLGSKHLNRAHMLEVVRVIAGLKKAGYKVVLVSSGAVAAGRELLGDPQLPAVLSSKQLLASVGQGRLIEIWESLFAIYDIHIGQILLTGADLDDRERFLNARDTLKALLDFNIVPVINENDAVCIQEIKVGDNDNLAAISGVLAEAAQVILFTDQKGLYTKDPRKFKDAKLIKEVHEITDEIYALAGGAGTSLGTGGMATKIKAASTALKAGMELIIASGAKPEIVFDLVKGEGEATFFKPTHSPLMVKKLWLSTMAKSSGQIVIDDGAKDAIVKKGASLLPSGIIKVTGEFYRGSIVTLCDLSGRKLAKGISRYSFDEVDRIKRKKSQDIDAILGFDHGAVVVHRDDLVVLGS